MKAAVAVTIAAAAAFGAGWWASSVVMAPPVAIAETAAPATVTVTAASIGRGLTVTARAERTESLIAQNSLEGVVTAVHSGETSVGQAVYEVAGIPVRAIAGDRPFYRDLARGTTGADVTFLQNAPVTMGYFTGEPDGRYGAGTDQAVRAWQRDLGIQVTGAVALGEVIAVPTLPAVLRVDTKIRPGVIVQGGEDAVRALSEDVAFALYLGDEQAALIPDSAAVAVTHDESMWPAAIDSREEQQDSTIALKLVAPGGGSVCGDACDALPAQDVSMLSARVELEAPATGPAVPVAAIVTDEAGAAYVTDPAGHRLPIDVIGSSGGLAVVDGVEVGQVLALPGVILADEPTGNLDPTNARHVLDALGSTGATVVIATHDPMVIDTVEEVVTL